MALSDTSRTQINKALAVHCGKSEYLRALAAGGPRFDLDGAPCGEVSQEHRAAAVLLLERRRKKATPPPPIVQVVAQANSTRPVLRLKSRRTA